MTGELGEFEGGERITPEPNESIDEFYIRLRGDEIDDETAHNVRISFGALNEYLDEKGIQLTQMKKEDVLDWCKWLITHRGVRQSTANNYLNNVTRPIIKLKKDNYIGGKDSPFEDARNTKPFDFESGAVWPEISYDRFTSAVVDIRDPRTFTATLTMCKTGLRISELCNIDERDVALEHPISDILTDPRREIANRSNVLYVDSSINSGEEHNGETREKSNKSMSTRKIPIDKELVDTLAWYLALRPRRKATGQPIFVSYTDPTERVGPDIIREKITQFAEDHGFNDRLSISPHFFRHWYVTQMRNNLSMIEPDKLPGTPKRIVKGLRGDSDDDTIDIYTHDWSAGLESNLSSTEQIVREQIPKFFK